MAIIEVVPFVVRRALTESGIMAEANVSKVVRHSKAIVD